MILKLDITIREIAKKVVRIQIPAYTIEAGLIDFHDIPPLKDTVASMQQCDELFYGFYMDNELCGVVSFKIEDRVIDIHRLMVHPTHFRKGIAGKLLDFIEENFKEYESMIVSTGTLNIPAVNFYETRGYARAGETLVANRLSMTSFSKKL